MPPKLSYITAYNLCILKQAVEILPAFLFWFKAYIIKQPKMAGKDQKEDWISFNNYKRQEKLVKTEKEYYTKETIV